MNPKKKWVERHGRIVRDRRSRHVHRFLGRSAPRPFRNLLNRRVRRRDFELLHHGRWEDFEVRLIHSAAWLWW